MRSFVQRSVLDGVPGFEVDSFLTVRYIGISMKCKFCHSCCDFSFLSRLSTKLASIVSLDYAVARRKKTISQPDGSLCSGVTLAAVSTCRTRYCTYW